MKFKVILGLLILSLTAVAFAANEPAIIPQPQKMVVKEGVFELTPNIRITTSSEDGKDTRVELEPLLARLRTATGFTLSWEMPLVGGLIDWVAEQMARPSLDFLLANKSENNLGQEGYVLSVRTNRIVIAAQTTTGLFYGYQTLLQLLPPEIFSTNKVSGVKWEIPCVEITDSPRFPWRGLMLDVSRHFFTKSEVEKLLDVMALHKLNTFHWHLTDDHGWRIEIKKYPKLTSVGAWRDGVGFGLATNSTTAYDPDGRYGGFYTQDDIREVVAYAAARHITIVPEIEMPGHALAALAAYPEFGTGSGPFTVPLKGGVNRGIYSPANEQTFQFLDDVLTEVAQLFPGKYIHIGGDEVPKEPWKNDATCQALMKREGFKNEEELQSWFIRRIEKIVSAKGKTILGWSEILQGGLAQNATVMDWIGGGREAASQGHDVVMSPKTHCYLDFYQSRNRTAEPRAIGGFLPLQTVYAFEPIPAKLAPEFHQHILGAQGNIWTEYISNLKQVEYMAFPRLAALAEVTWSPKEVRQYDDFLRRLKLHEQRLEQLGVSYRKSTLGDGADATPVKPKAKPKTKSISSQ